MSKPENPLVLLLTAIVTAGIAVGGFWWLSKAAPNLFGSSPASTTGSQNLVKLTILGDTFSGYSTFRHQAFKDEIAKAGIELNYQDEFDQAKRAQRLNQNQADLLVTTLDQFLKQKPQGKIVGLIDRTAGADAAVLNSKKYPNLRSLLELNQLVQQQRSQGQQLILTFAGETPSEYLALVLSTKFEAFKLSDFQVSKVADASDAWKLLQDPAQNAAVAIIWEPYVTQARQKGYQVVLSSKDAPGAIIDVIVASDRLLQSQPDKVSELLAAYYRRIDANVVNSSQLQAQIAEDGKLSPSDAAAVLQGIEFFTAPEAQEWFNNGTLDKRIGSTAAVLALAGKLDRVPAAPKTLYSSDLISKAATSTQKLISSIRADNPQLADRLAGKGKAIAPAITPKQVQAAASIGNLQARGEVQFQTGSAQLTPVGKQTLDKLASEIAEFNPQTVAIRAIGHTSKVGAADFNQQLSQQRAETVAQYLRSRQIPHNIVAEGKGFSQPLSGVPPEDPRNQRTEIRLVRIN